jgi:hypothetical protein
MLTNRRMAVLVAAALLCGAPGWAAAAKTYQVTGPVVELTDKMIVVQKGDERFEVARDENTKLPANVKVGDKVTLHYRMNATTVETKPSGQGKNSKK